MMGQTILERDLEWLRELNDKLWKEQYEHHKLGSGYVKIESGARLGDDEWVRVRKLIEEHRLPVTMINTRFGFGIGLLVYGPEREWIYPGVEDESKPEAITMISQSQLPESEGVKGTGDVKFKIAWSCFSPLTHGDANVTRLRRNSLKEPGPQSRYVY